MQEMSLFFRDAAGNIWEGNVMLSGIGFRILLQNEAKMLKIQMMGIWEFTVLLALLHRCEYFNKKAFKKLQAGKYAPGTPASMKLTT